MEKVTFGKRTVNYLKQYLRVAREIGDRENIDKISSFLMRNDRIHLEKISEYLQRSVRTLQRWVQDFLSKHFDCFRRKKSPGRPCKLTKTQKKKLKELILKGPEKNGFHTGIWTSALIQELIFKEFNVTYSVFYISELMHTMGLSYILPKQFANKADPIKQREWIEDTFPAIVKKSIQENSIILFEDESWFYRGWNKARSWYEKGNPSYVKFDNPKESRTIFGALEFGSGKFRYQIHDSKKEGKVDNNRYLKFVKYLVKCYNGRKIILISDNGPCHHGYQLNEYLKKNKNIIEIEPLPAYSPQFNPIERVWKRIKRDCIHNRYFKTSKTFVRALRYGLQMSQRTCEKNISFMRKELAIYNKIRNDLFHCCSNAELSEVLI